MLLIYSSSPSLSLPRGVFYFIFLGVLGQIIKFKSSSSSHQIDFSSQNVIRTHALVTAVAQWLRASNIFRQICKSTSEWRGFKSRWFYQLGFEFAKTLLNH